MSVSKFLTAFTFHFLWAGILGMFGLLLFYILQSLL